YYGYGDYSGYGYGADPYYGYGGYASADPYANWGYGTGYDVNGVGLGSYGAAGTVIVPDGYVDAVPPITTPIVPTTVPSTDPLAGPAVANDTAAAPTGFVEKGEAAFKRGDYANAIREWQHALIDNQQDPLVTMLLGQALFASGKYDEAAGATQTAMRLLPKEEWGTVVNKHQELYGNGQDYANQLRALENSVADKPNDPGRRFLLGFQYSYLGYPQQGIDQLNQVLKLAPEDELSKVLRDEIQAHPPQQTAPAIGPSRKDLS